MAHKKWMHIYWKRFEFNACLPTTDLPAPMIYFPRLLWLHHFFCRTSGSCFVSATAAPYQRHSLPLLFILSRAVFFIPPSRILFRHLAANNSLRFAEPVSQSGNRRGAVPPPSRRARINSACDSRGHNCRCAGRHVIFWHTQTETPEWRRGGGGGGGTQWKCNASPLLAWPFHTSCCRSLIAHSSFMCRRDILALNGRGCSYTSSGIVCSLLESPEREAGATPPPHTDCRDESRWEERTRWMQKGGRQPLSDAFECAATRDTCGIPPNSVLFRGPKKCSWVWFKL